VRDSRSRQEKTAMGLLQSVRFALQRVRGKPRCSAPTLIKSTTSRHSRRVVSNVLILATPGFTCECV
jgi:hypothetical protein